MIACYLKSPGLLSVFWPILMMLESGWSLLVLLFSSLPVLLPMFGNCSDSTSYNWYHRHFHVPYFLVLFLLSFNFILRSVGTIKSTIWQFLSLSLSLFFFLFVCWQSQGLVIWPKLSDPFVFQNPRVRKSHCPGRIPGSAYTTYSYGQISISCTVPSVSPPPSPVL